MSELIKTLPDFEPDNQRDTTYCVVEFFCRRCGHRETTKIVRGKSSYHDFGNTSDTVEMRVCERCPL